MSLHQLLDETIPAPPPFASVDDLIVRERRAVRRRRTVGSCAAATVLAVVVGVVAGGTRWGNSFGLVGGPAPASSPHDPARQWLDNAVRAAMLREAPDLKWLDSGFRTTPANPDPTWYSTWVDSPSDNADGRVYSASAVFRSQGLTGTLTVNVSRLLPDQPSPACFPPGVDGVTCVLVTGERGEKIRLATIHYPVSPAQIEISVEVLRTDGTHIWVMVRNQGGGTENDAATGEAPPMELDQVQRVALDPSLVAEAQVAPPTNHPWAD